MGLGGAGTGQREARCKNVTTTMFMLAARVLSLDLEPLCWRRPRVAASEEEFRRLSQAGFAIISCLPPPPLLRHQNPRKVGQGNPR